MTFIRTALALALVAFAPQLARGQELGACWIDQGGDDCLLTTWEECWDLCGCFCGEGTTCEDLCFCDDVPDPDASGAPAWDAQGPFVTPGTQSAVDEVTVLVAIQYGACVDPIAGADVEIDLSDCSNLCVDSPDGLSGMTDADGLATLNPRAGGCADCQIVIRANGVVIAVYSGVASTDWDGRQADGTVSGPDLSFFAGAFNQSQDACADYNGDDSVSGIDFSMFAESFKGADKNTEICP